MLDSVINICVVLTSLSFMNNIVEMSLLPYWTPLQLCLQHASALSVLTFCSNDSVLLAREGGRGGGGKIDVSHSLTSPSTACA